MKLTKGKISKMLKSNHQTLKRARSGSGAGTGTGSLPVKETRPNHFTRNNARKRPHLSNKTLCNVKRDKKEDKVLR